MDHDREFCQFFATFRDFCEEQKMIEQLEEQIYHSWNSLSDDFHSFLSGSENGEK
jgi:hypothetical protein